MKRILERLNSDCFITSSPAGTIHLTWRQFTLHMTRSDFCELARVLRLVATYPPCGHWIGGHPCAARYNSPESITLQLFGITLCLSTADLFDLQRMVQAALVQLAGHNAAPFWRYIDAEIPEQPEIVIPLN